MRTVEALGHEIALGNDVDTARFSKARDFIFIPSQMIPPGERRPTLGRSWKVRSPDVTGYWFHLVLDTHALHAPHYALDKSDQQDER
jgi:hypothetical protein